MSRWFLPFVLSMFFGCTNSVTNDGGCVLHSDCPDGLCLEGRCAVDESSNERADAAPANDQDSEIGDDDCRTSERGCNAPFVCRRNWRPMKLLIVGQSGRAVTSLMCALKMKMACTNASSAMAQIWRLILISIAMLVSAVKVAVA